LLVKRQRIIYDFIKRSAADQSGKKQRGTGIILPDTWIPSIHDGMTKMIVLVYQATKKPKSLLPQL
jgi:hypothetical protein